MKVEKQITLAFAALGAIVGYLGYTLMNNYFAVTLALAVLFISMKVFEIIFKKKENYKWFMSNGGWIYIFVWLVIWIVFYNM
jgi:hypothetical protein